EALPGEPVELERLLVLELGEPGHVPSRRDHQMSRGVRELVEQDESTLAAVDDEPLLVAAGIREAEDATLLLVGGGHVLEAPRCPELLHRLSLTRLRLDSLRTKTIECCDPGGQETRPIRPEPPTRGDTAPT